MLQLIFIIYINIQCHYNCELLNIDNFDKYNLKRFLDFQNNY